MFGDEIAACSKCGGKLKLISLIKDPAVIRPILEHVGLPTELPPVAPARSPPQREFEYAA